MVARNTNAQDFSDIWIYGDVLLCMFGETGTVTDRFPVSLSGAGERNADVIR